MQRPNYEATFSSQERGPLSVFEKSTLNYKLMKSKNNDRVSLHNDVDHSLLLAIQFVA
jgi:hypothetical protein